MEEERIESLILNSLEEEAMIFSDCLKKDRQVGAVVLREERLHEYFLINYQPTATNQAPKGMDKCRKCPREKSGTGVETFSCRIVHAEVRAIIKYLQLHGNKFISFTSIGDFDGTVMFTTLFPCNNCAMLIIDCGIKKIYYRHEYDLELMGIVKQYFDEAGISYIKM